MQGGHQSGSDTKSNGSKNTDTPKTSTRRSVIRNADLSAASLSVLGVGTSAAQSSTPEGGNRTGNGTGTPEDGPEVEPDAMVSATTNFSPYNISTDETSILESGWQFQTVPPIPGNYYQIDILVNSDHVSEPETVSQNVGEDNITKDWEYRDSSPVGSAYQWQAKILVADVLGASAQVNAEITPTDTGEVEAKTGTFWPWQAWSTGTLDIN
jgi:hypothetical protein